MNAHEFLLALATGGTIGGAFGYALAHFNAHEFAARQAARINDLTADLCELACNVARHGYAAQRLVIGDATEADMTNFEVASGAMAAKAASVLRDMMLIGEPK
jgi:hypothetical protein